MDVLKKTLLAGIGAAVITKDRLEAALDEFVQEGKVTSAEARAMAEKIATDGRREFDNLSHQLNEKIREHFSSRDRSTQEKIAALEARIAALEEANAAPKPDPTPKV